MKVDLFDFDLPPELIATRPVRPRDAEAAQTEVVNAARRLEAAGEIALLRPEDGAGSAA